MTDISQLDPSTAVVGRDPWRRLARATGIAGLVAFVLVFTPIIAVSTQGEPPFTATAEQAHAFFVNAGDAGWRSLANAARAGRPRPALVRRRVRSASRPRRRQPALALVAAGVSGLLLPAYLVLDVSWNAAINRAADIDPGLAAYAFDVGNLGFANIWIAIGSFAIATGWVLVSTRMLPRGLGWWAIAAGAGLVLARFAWTSEAWLLPYFAFFGSGSSRLHPAHPRPGPPHPLRPCDRGGLPCVRSTSSSAR